MVRPLRVVPYTTLYPWQYSVIHCIILYTIFFIKNQQSSNLKTGQQTVNSVDELKRRGGTLTVGRTQTTAKVPAGVPALAPVTSLPPRDTPRPPRRRTQGQTSPPTDPLEAHPRRPSRGKRGVIFFADPTRSGKAARRVKNRGELRKPVKETAGKNQSRSRNPLPAPEPAQLHQNQLQLPRTARAPETLQLPRTSAAAPEPAALSEPVQLLQTPHCPNPSKENQLPAPEPSKANPAAAPEPSREQNHCSCTKTHKGKQTLRCPKNQSKTNQLHCSRTSCLPKPLQLPQTSCSCTKPPREANQLPPKPSCLLQTIKEAEPCTAPNHCSCSKP
ncbi:uncharacterized protein DKFZp434B061-like [Penaeus monodon]|uniref:uncharacterized protein DKFZp434B061-like n=1 Tax=Penaeus monodon TaxID=6687 RepID=UPI0018A71646|nr:uncharacterized protein DKFZp434B061-like [Penaeus monodon]